MSSTTLRNRILHAFFWVILVSGGATTLLSGYLIRKDIVLKAQEEVRNALDAAHALYYDQLENIRVAMSVITPEKNNLKNLKAKIGLDYLYNVPAETKNSVRSEIAQSAFLGYAIGGTRIISKDELGEMGPQYAQNAYIKLVDTPKARPIKKTELVEALAIEYAMPVYDEQNRLASVLYGGKIINRDFSLVDKIRNLVFTQAVGSGKSAMTVTIFLDDVRVSTNVLNRDGQRAIGTRISENVYNKVAKQGKRWSDRAFVVSDWHLTSYEPIRDIKGSIIGILYVGIMERPFKELEARFFTGLLLIIILAAVIAVLFSYLLTASITKPVGRMMDTIHKISAGQMHHRVDFVSSLKELTDLTDSFDDMAHKLDERQRHLNSANEKLASLNKSYIDMIGFVSHELKGILGSVVMNIYSVKDGYLGHLSEKQQRAVDAAAKSLDHFETVVKNYLDLSRIEKGELQVTRSQVDLNDDVIKPAIGHFEKQRQEKHMHIENNAASGLNVKVDKSLIGIVCNNLIGNAVKYGIVGGKVAIDVTGQNAHVQVRVYNDGIPIPEEQLDLLFKKFSRLPASENIKGTGLGLFIIKEIVQKHGGRVWVEPQEKGNAFYFTLLKD